MKVISILAGLVLVNINPSYKSSELSYVLKMCEISGLITDTEYGRQNYEEILYQAVDQSESSLSLDFIAHRGQEFSQMKGIRTFPFDNLRDEADSIFRDEVEKIIQTSQIDDHVNIQFRVGIIR